MRELTELYADMDRLEKAVPGTTAFLAAQNAEQLHREGRRPMPETPTAAVLASLQPRSRLFHYAQALAYDWTNRAKQDAAYEAMNVLFDGGTEEDARRKLGKYAPPR